MNIGNITSMSPGERADRIKEIDGLIVGYQNQARMIRSDCSDPSGYQRRRADLVRSIDRLQKQLAELDARAENGPALLNMTDDRIKELRAERKLLENANAVARLLDLQNRIGELSNADS